MSLALRDIHFGYGSKEVLQGVTLELSAGQFTGLLGPNGSGKSTMLRLCAGILQSQRGRVELEERHLKSYDRRTLASRIAFVAQSISMVFPYTCREVVMMGRYPYFKGLGLSEEPHREIVEKCMAETGVLELQERRVTELSGGEAQRVQIARALAQEADHLLLDEPTSHLDVKFQMEVMELLWRLNRERKICILVSLHDLNLASLYCEHLVLLKDGTIYAQGAPGQVLTTAALDEVFGVQGDVSPGPEGRPRVELLPVRFVDGP